MKNRIDDKSEFPITQTKQIIFEANLCLSRYYQTVENIAGKKDHTFSIFIEKIIFQWFNFNPRQFW